MKFEDLILRNLMHDNEFMLLNANGDILNASNTLFKGQDLVGKSIWATAPFLVDYLKETASIESGESIEIDCIKSDLFNRYGIYDIKFSPVKNDSKENNILIEIEDRSAHYSGLQDSHQHKTELMLNRDAIVRQTEIIKQQNEEIKALIKETHHRIKNNLQVVSSLIQFQSREVKDKQVKEMFNDLQNRVHSIAAIHEKLYRSSNLKEVNVYEYITLLVHELIENYSVGKKIEVNVRIAPFNIGVKTLVPLGLLINELVANSLKHGFKDRNEGRIEIKLEHLDGNRFRLIVSDDGSGIPKDFLVKNGESMGSELIQIFTNQLWGTVSILDEPGGVVQIDFNLIDNFT